MRKLLIWLWVIQVYSNKNKSDKKGRGFTSARRLNPYNPLSYVTLIVAFTVGIIMFGFVGIWKETDLSNPFKWN